MTKNNEVAALKSRHFLLSLHFLLPILILAAGTLLFRATSLDLEIQSRYYLGSGEWAFNDLPWAKFIYHYGNIPALLISLAALLSFIFSFSKAKALPYRKITVYLLLAMLIGPGLIANTILKDNWGRPRPRELIQFGGEYRYEAPLSIDPSSSGKSFPCGHATMGFYFFALGFLPLGKRKLWSFLCMLFALMWGSLIGWIRIGMGGHFASDVLWAAGIVYLASYGLFRLLKLHREPFYYPNSLLPHQALKLYQKLLLGLLGLLILGGVLLATPYSAKKTFPLEVMIPKQEKLTLELSFETADLSIVCAGQSQFSYRNNGFGFPGSKLKTRHSYQGDAFTFAQWKKGFFTELNCRANLQLKAGQIKNLQVLVKQGRVELSDGMVDTLWTDPGSKIVGSPLRTIVLPGEKPKTGWWLKAPEISIK